MVRGGLIRGIGFGISTALGLATAVLLLRHLGVNDFGRYATVMAVLGIVAGITDAGLTAVGSREISVARTAVSLISMDIVGKLSRISGRGGNLGHTCVGRGTEWHPGRRVGNGQYWRSGRASTRFAAVNPAIP